jgi:uncharacterized membrane protein YeaQ/YmgE (transglycosylase-associated protein family)
MAVLSTHSPSWRFAQLLLWIAAARLKAIQQKGFMNTLIWIVFGGLVGWVATVVTGSDPAFGVIGNIIIGIVGSWLGGWISTRIFKGPPVTGFDFRSFVVAVLGSIVLIFLVGLVFAGR